VTTDYLFSVYQLPSQQSRHDRFGHYATADKSQPRSGKRISFFVGFLDLKLGHTHLKPTRVMLVITRLGPYKSLAGSIAQPHEMRYSLICFLFPHKC
jgi:hypothetical protein